MNSGKKNLLLWTELTDIQKKKQAIAAHLALTGRARNASSELAATEISCDNGIKNLLEKLDRVFLQDVNWKCFNTYLAFENFQL